MKSLKFSTVLVAVALLSTGTQWRKLKSQLQALEITLYSSCNVTVIFHQKKKKGEGDYDDTNNFMYVIIVITLSFIFFCLHPNITLKMNCEIKV